MVLTGSDFAFVAALAPISIITADKLTKMMYGSPTRKSFRQFEDPMNALSPDSAHK